MPARPPCYLEIKNVHLMRQPGLAEFPDAVTKRGAKHLDELGDMVAAGARAVMLFLIQIGSAQRFKLARDIDPAYGKAFDAARAAGVEIVRLSLRHHLRRDRGDRAGRDRRVKEPDARPRVLGGVSWAGCSASGIGDAADFGQMAPAG